MRGFFRPILVVSAGVLAAGTATLAVTGMLTNTSGSLTFQSAHAVPKPELYSSVGLRERVAQDRARAEKMARLLAIRPVVTTDKGNRRTPEQIINARFEAVSAKAKVTPQKIAALLDRHAASKGNAIPGGAVVAAAAALPASAGAPSTDRFGVTLPDQVEQHPTVLAYANPGPTGGAGAALSAMLSTQDDLAATQAPDTAESPAFPDTPTAGPLPQGRPRSEPAQAAQPAQDKPDAAPATQAVLTAPKQILTAPTPPKPQVLENPKVVAYARPDMPAQRNNGGFGQALRNLFGGGGGKVTATQGVAVYDISAARVYMPDGSVLEAHSGIGEMADNPRYVNVSMNGPTPPHIYNLRMREKLFHGVEAIRMLPLDGKNKYGRDGFLTHSYLLRGRTAQSHGCVAFKEYERFLNAFKQGKVKQIVVVPNGGQAAGIRVASAAGVI